MANFLEGDTICAYNEEKSNKGFCMYCESWASMENFQMIDLEGRIYHFTTDPTNKNREEYTDRERRYFLSVNTCRIVLFEKTLYTENGLIEIR